MTERTQFAERGMSLAPRQDLTMLCYQQMPMLPRHPSNVTQKKVMERVKDLPAAAAPTIKTVREEKKQKVEAVKPKRVREPRPSRAKKSRDEHYKAQRDAADAHNLARMVSVYQDDAILSSTAIAARLGLSRASASPVLKLWVERELIVEAGVIPRTGSYGQPTKMYRRMK